LTTARSFPGWPTSAPEQSSLSDLYDISGDGTCRDGWKKLINALLFASKPLSAWPNDTRDEFPRGTKLKAAIGAIKLKHAAIAPLFEHGLGYELMRRERGDSNHPG